MIYPEINAYLEWLKANNREHSIDSYCDWEESRGVTYGGSGWSIVRKFPVPQSGEMSRRWEDPTHQDNKDSN